MIIGGMDVNGTPRLFQTEPSSAYYEWVANATGRGQKTVKEFLEKHYKADELTNEASTLRLAIKALSEVVQSGAANVEVGSITRDPKNPTKTTFRMLGVEEVESLFKSVAAETADAADKDPS